MSSWAKRLLLACVSLFACCLLGEGNQACAGFTAGRLVLLSPIPETPLFTFGLLPTLHGNSFDDAPSSMSSSSVGMNKAALVASWLLIPARMPNGPTASEGMSASPTIETSGGSGQQIVLFENRAPTEEVRGRVFLSENRDHPPPFASRLFRPPRVVR
jgi:hypothetical protein